MAPACAARVPFSWEQRPGVPLPPQSHSESAPLSGTTDSSSMAPPTPCTDKPGCFPKTPAHTPPIRRSPLPPPPCHSADAPHPAAAALLAPPSSSPDPPSVPVLPPPGFAGRHRAASFPPFVNARKSSAGRGSTPPKPCELEDDPFLLAIHACTQPTDWGDERELVSHHTGNPCSSISAHGGSEMECEPLDAKSVNVARLRAMARDAGISVGGAAKSGAMRGEAESYPKVRIAESYGGVRASLGKLMTGSPQREKVYVGHPAFMAAGFDGQWSKHARPKVSLVTGAGGGRGHRRSSSQNHGWSCRSVNHNDSIVRVQNPRPFSP